MARPRGVMPADGPAWVTGASSGIGRSVALELADQGWTVIATARGAEALAALALERPGRIVPAAADITDAVGIAEAVRRAEESVGKPVARAILNAGTFRPDDAHSFELDRFRETVDVNLVGTANSLAAVMPAMIARRAGQIAIVSSVAGYGGLPTSIAYGATKAALINMAESLWFDLVKEGVDLRLVCPGFVKTPLTDKNTFSMPFLMPVDKAAKALCRGLDGSGFEVNFPRAFTWQLKLMRLLPYWLYFALVRGATKG